MPHRTDYTPNSEVTLLNTWLINILSILPVIEGHAKLLMCCKFLTRHNQQDRVLKF